jgi:hypothetical protein
LAVIAVVVGLRRAVFADASLADGERLRLDEFAARELVVFAITLPHA